MSIAKFITYAVVGIGFLAGCAIKVAPAGGDRDQVPPQMLHSSPLQKQTGIFPAEIKITFDEFMHFRDLNSQLMISPPISPDPEITVVGKSIKINIDTLLRPNTTYSFNFGSSIEDLHENNKLVDFKFVFSTGQFLDTLKIKGRVVNAYTLGGEPGCFVMLYSHADDSVPMKMKPNYISRTDTSGYFNLENLAAGNYRLFALKDLNSDFLFSQPSEKIAFSSEPVLPDTNPNPIELRMFLQPVEEQKLLKSWSPHRGKIMLAYRNPVKGFKTEKLDPSMLPDFKSPIFNDSGDTITLWISNLPSDTLDFIALADGVKDTLNMMMEKPEAGAGSTRGKIPFKLTGNLKSHRNPIGQEMSVLFNHPLQEINGSLIFFVTDSTSEPIGTIGLDMTNLEFFTSRVMEEGHLYKLKAFPGAFTDIFGLQSDSMLLEVKCGFKPEFGTIHVKYPEGAENETRIFQLLNEKGVLAEQKVSRQKKPVSFHLLAPGKYKLKCIVDSNDNGKWDPGIYIQKLQPEKVFYLGGEIEVKGDWENEVTWDN